MVDIGIHPFAWIGQWTGASVSLIGHCKELGFDLMDVPVRTLDADGIAATRNMLRLQKMGVVAVAGVGLPYDVTAADAETRQAAVAYIEQLVSNAAGIGASILAGVLYAPVGKFTGAAPQEDELARSAQALAQIARFAAALGVRLALEPLNRYETYVLNTVEQALSLIDRIGEPNVGVQFDTYQMITEEKDYYRALTLAGDRLLHVHACENDRGAPGSGLVPWDAVFSALRDLRYDGALSIESFARPLPDTAATTRIWRPVAADADTLARDGLAFLRQKADEYGLLRNIL